MALRRLDHVLVLTDDLERTRAFYCDVLGLEVGDRPSLEFPGFWLYAGDAPCVHIADRGAYEAHAVQRGLASTGSAVDHVAFVADDGAQVTARLEATGVESVENSVPAAGIRQLFLTDPGGARIELVVPEEPGTTGVL